MAAWIMVVDGLPSAMYPDEAAARKALDALDDMVDVEAWIEEMD